MRYTKNWKEYKLLDASCGERLEQWGKYILIRPDPQIIWKTEKKDPRWTQSDAIYYRSNTGGATLACAEKGAKVCHVDASKGMVSWARENAKLSKLDSCPVRWIVDDCEKFVRREIKRGNKYDGIIMDPPSYGRGPKGEIWKIEDNIFDFILLCESLLSENARFFVINSYSTGLSPSVMAYLLSEIIKKKRGGFVHADEIGLPVESSNLVIPSGATAIWSNEKLF